MTQAIRDENHITVALGVSSTSSTTTLPFKIDSSTGRLLVDSASAAGTVTSVSVATANGFAGSVADPTTTPAITIETTVTGILQGNGTAISAITVGTGLTFSAGTLSADVPSTITVANEAADATCFVGFFTAATGDLQPKTNAGLTFDSTTAKLTATLLVGTTSVTSATVRASANDSGSIGASGTAFSDLFLADGAVVNFNAGNYTITHASNQLTFASGANTTQIFSGTSGFTTVRFDSGAIQGYMFADDSSAAVYFGSNSNHPVIFRVNNASEVTLTATALSPAVDGGNSLGTTSLGWQNLFGNTGFVINIENSDWVATHTAGILTVGTGDLRVTNAGTNADSVVTVGGTQTLTNKTLTSPTITTATLSGAQQLAEGASIRLDQTLSADGTWSGTTIAGTAGTTLAFGDLVYLAVADSRWELCDADSVTTAGAVLMGFCVLAAAADGDPTVILIDGNIRADANFPALTVGAPVYASTSPGDIQVAQPNGTDDVIQVVGFALTADSIIVRISPDYITHT